MALFNRRNKVDAPEVAPELQSYYKAENREKTWMAWLLGLGTLVVTILLALALFFGGRWAYRKIRNEPAKVTTVQTDNGLEGISEGSTPESTNSDDAPQSAPANNPTPGASTPTPSSSTTTRSSDLPNTGPADTLAIFIAVSVLAYVAHRRYIAHSA